MRNFELFSNFTQIIFLFLSLVPDGLRAPNVTVLSSTSVHVTWLEPALPNGNIVSYRLHQKSGNMETILFSGLGFSLTVANLRPFTVYEFRVNASTIAGSEFSEWSRITTLEDGKFVSYYAFSTAIRCLFQ